MRAVLFLFLAACGSSGIAPNGNPDDGTSSDGGGGGDASVDMAMPLTDMAMYQPPTDAAGLMCGMNPPCTGNNICCVKAVGDGGTANCAAACPGGVQIQCVGPGNCGGDPCCLTIANMAPQSILCGKTPKSCVPNFNASGSGMTRLCSVDGDCTAGGVMTMYNQCCHYTQGQMTKICFNASFVAFTQGQIACP